MIQLEILQVLDCPNVPLLEQRIEQALAGVSIEWETAPPGHRGFPISSTRGYGRVSDVARRRPRSLSRVKSDPERVLQALSRCRGRCRRRSYCVGAEESIRNGLTNVDSR